MRWGANEGGLPQAQSSRIGGSTPMVGRESGIQWITQSFCAVAVLAHDGDAMYRVQPCDEQYSC